MHKQRMISETVIRAYLGSYVVLFNVVKAARGDDDYWRKMVFVRCQDFSLAELVISGNPSL